MDNTAWATTRQRLTTFVAARISPPSAAEDVVHDVLAKMIASIDQLEDTAKLDAWAYQIARNAITDEFRRRGRQSTLVSSLSPPVEATGDLPADAATASDQVELSGCLRPMIDALADPYRQALTLTGLDGLTQDAAAAEAGVSLPAMKSRVLRARRGLREQLQACCDIDADEHGHHGHPRTQSCSSDPNEACGCGS